MHWLCHVWVWGFCWVFLCPPGSAHCSPCSEHCCRGKFLCGWVDNWQKCLVAGSEGHWMLLISQLHSTQRCASYTNSADCKITQGALTSYLDYRFLIPPLEDRPACVSSFEKHCYFKISCFVMFVLEIFSLNPPPGIADVLPAISLRLVCFHGSHRKELVWIS